jgi:hypothetical protein
LRLVRNLGSAPCGSSTFLSFQWLVAVREEWLIVESVLVAVITRIFETEP